MKKEKEEDVVILDDGFLDEMLKIEREAKREALEDLKRQEEECKKQEKQSD